MIETLGTVLLRSGESLAVKLLVPPEEGHAERLAHFLEHKGDMSRRSILQRLRGKYAASCGDRYFFGEIDGKIAGQLWYGYANSGTGIANFGHVYTEPEHRRKGIARELMKFFLEDFHAGPARIALCGTGTPWVARIYFHFGFQPVVEGADRGALILIKEGCGEDFRAVEAEYFLPGQALAVRTGDVSQRHDIDKLLSAALMVRNMSSRRVAMASLVRSYEDAIFRVEDGQGLVTVATTPGNHTMGWAFILNTGSRLETNTRIFDYEIHPNYADAARQFIEGSLALAEDAGVAQVYAYIPGCEPGKLKVLTESGFREAARLMGSLAGCGVPPENARKYAPSGFGP